MGDNVINSSDALRRRLVRATHVIGANPEASEQQLVESLCSIGHSELDAEVLVSFIPLGLARALIFRFPGTVSTKLSDHAIVLKGGHELELPLMRVPEFVEALRLGEETFTTGVIPREIFSEAIGLSVEFKLINEALNAGTTLTTISPPILIRLGEVAGFDEWCKRLTTPATTS